MTEPQIQRFIEGVISVTDSPANSKKLGKCAGILGDTLREPVQRGLQQTNLLQDNGGSDRNC